MTGLAELVGTLDRSVTTRVTLMLLLMLILLLLLLLLIVMMQMSVHVLQLDGVTGLWRWQRGRMMMVTIIAGRRVSGC